MKLEFKCPRCGKSKSIEADGESFIPCNCDPRAEELEHRAAIERRKELRRRSNRRQ